MEKTEDKLQILATVINIIKLLLQPQRAYHSSIFRREILEMRIKNEMAHSALMIFRR